jgi:hypothetical protein
MGSGGVFLKPTRVVGSNPGNNSLRYMAVVQAIMECEELGIY